MQKLQSDTIAAIATGVGGGIGIVRVSGPGALEVGDKVFAGRAGRSLGDAAPFTLTLGSLRDPRSGELIDEVLAARMPAGRSYTGEPVVEIQAHGGRLVLELALDAALRAGARLAEPGEFTRRAFLSGRLGLSEAEAVAEIVAAESRNALRSSLRQLRGSLGERIGSLRERVLGLAASVEVAIDFSDDAPSDPPRLDEAGRIAADARSLISLAEHSAVRGEGTRVVIAGPVNAGKSSIFNYLARFDRAIVSPVPGTTRDYVEARAVVGGCPVTLVDTAGMRTTDDVAEAEGVRRSTDQVQGADVVVVVLDGSCEPAPEEDGLLSVPGQVSPIVALNKSDLPLHRARRVAALPSGPDGRRCVVSAATGEGLGDLEAAIASRCRDVGSVAVSEEPLPNVRHRNALARAADRLDAAAAARSAGWMDAAAFELQGALSALGEITGETATDEILDLIFSKFCIGK